MRTTASLVLVAAISLQLVAGKSFHLAGKADSVVASSSGHSSPPASSSHQSSAQESSPGTSAEPSANPSPEPSAEPAPEPNGDEQAPDGDDDQGDNQDYGGGDQGNNDQNYGGGYANQQAYDEATTTILQYDGAATANTVNGGNPIATLGSCPDYTVTVTNQVYATLVTTVTPTWLAMPPTP